MKNIIKKFYRKYLQLKDYYFETSISKTLFYKFVISKNITVGKKSKIIIHSKANVHVNDKFVLGSKYSLLCRQPSILEIKPNATLNVGKVNIGKGTVIVINDNANLSIGDNTYFSGDSKVYAVNNIKIGKNCAISWGLTLIDSDFHTITAPIKSTKTQPITIGDNVWIGCNCTILKGVTIGDGAVIASNSVIKKNVPPNTLVGGNPAKVIKENVQWEL